MLLTFKLTLSPLVHCSSHYTNDCTSMDPSVSILKFADNTTVIGHAEDIQPAPGADGSVLHCHHRITTFITGWGSSTTNHDIHRLQHIIRFAEKTTGVKMPTLLDLHTSRMRRCVEEITADPSQPGHHLFQHLPSGQCFIQMSITTTQLQKSFCSYAIKLMNS
ncbi:hypothetical protein P4O66_014558 [Electrophorus voltai]|uniref:Peptidase S1 domain-containing protein n=1 Tax=Electrophorus voltai TaxID=2609070 RepID=A0AAD9DT27_9TELE|nr:hypothetical protein P4O66_014558 [Electrophorus voltai]